MGFALSLSFALTGCGATPPACDDSAVTDTVLNIVLTQLRQANFTSVAMKNGVYDEMNYERAVQKQDDNKLLKLVVDKVEANFPEGHMDLEAIRTTDIDEEIAATGCAARLTGKNHARMDLTYTAQETEDGDIWVEVYGL